MYVVISLTIGSLELHRTHSSQWECEPLIENTH